jgi:GNAT superfamily N-acetyltransferase
MPGERTHIDLRVSPDVSDAELNGLFSASWHGYVDRQFGKVLARSLAFVCAYDCDRLIGFVNVAWDGGSHAFILDTTVLPDHRRNGVGTELVKRATQAAAMAGVEWLHVDFEPHLSEFYRRCGFHPTTAGLVRLSASGGG